MSETSIKIDLLQHLEILISGRLRTNIVKGFQIKFMSLVCVSFHQSCPSFYGMPSMDNKDSQFLLSKEPFR